MMSKVFSWRSLLPEILLPLAAYLYFANRYHSMPYMAGGAVLLAACLFLLLAESPLQRLPLGTAVLALAALALPTLGIWQFMRLLDPGDVDQSCYACALWNLRHGETYYSVADMDIFGNHANYTLVLWIPVHILAGELGLKIGKILCLLAAVWLAFRSHWARDREAASLGAAALLLSPPIMSQFFFGFHPEFLAAPVLVLAFHAYRDQRLGRFLLCTAFLAYSKEVFTLAVAGILLVAVVERRSWKWILAPGLLCTVQVGVYLFAVVPHFSPGGISLGGFLPVPGEIPGNLFRGGTLIYGMHLFLPFLPVLARLPKRFLLLPVPLFVFYSAIPDPSFRELTRHYAFPIALLAVGGMVMLPGHASAGKDEGGSASRQAMNRRTMLAFLAASLLSYPLGLPRLDFLKADGPKQAAMARLESMVPGNASILVNGSFITRFAARKDIGNWIYRHKEFSHYQFLLLDRNYKLDVPGLEERLHREIDSLSKSPAWNKIHDENGILLLQRKEPSLIPEP